MNNTTHTLMSLADAVARIHETLEPLPEIEQVGLHSALGRVLAYEVKSLLNVPAHRNSAMDGYAVRHSDLAQEGETELEVVGVAYAGRPWPGNVMAGQAVRIMTGAVVPEGADTVVMQEHTQREGEQIRIDRGHQEGENVRYPGEDIACGQAVLPAGRRLRPADLGLLAAVGIAGVTVMRRPRVALFSTGDELRCPGEILEVGQIYDSNRFILRGALQRMGVEVIDLGVIPDCREMIATAFEKAARKADAIISSGGVSVGDADYVKETLERMGRIGFWKIAIKPGKPLAFGKLDDAWFFGLPGNPVSALVTFTQVVRPALERLAGQIPEAIPLLRLRCVEPLKKAPGRMEFQRGILQTDEHGETVVLPAGLQGSHLLGAMSRANCFILLEAEQGNVAANTMVTVQPFDALLM